MRTSKPMLHLDLILKIVSDQSHAEEAQLLLVGLHFFFFFWHIGQTRYVFRTRFFGHDECFFSIHCIVYFLIISLLFYVTYFYVTCYCDIMCQYCLNRLMQVILLITYLSFLFTLLLHQMFFCYYVLVSRQLPVQIILFDFLFNFV